MGIAIAYRGRLADIARVEDFEDRLLDLALEFGGMPQIWRSHADADPARMVRGILLDIAPGLESVSLLISPEGWIIGLVDVDEAKSGRLASPPWCSTRTHLGPLDGHVAIVEMLTILQREFVPGLEVRDEAGYWETRDLARLVRRRAAVNEAKEALAEGWDPQGFSREAAEDPNILVRHIERVTARVHGILGAPVRHPLVTFPAADEVGNPVSAAATEAAWEAMFKTNRRQEQQLQRAIEERRGRGEDDDASFANALRDLGLELPCDEGEDDDSWGDTLHSALANDDTTMDGRIDPDDPFEDIVTERHPLLLRAMELLKDLHEHFGKIDARFALPLRTMFQGAGEVMGGLAQALSDPGIDDDDLGDYGLRVVQFKRALRGAAYARGALIALKSALSTENFQRLSRTLGTMEHEVFEELARLRAKHPSEER